MQEMQETWLQSLSREDPLEKEMATHVSILAWKTPWTQEPGGLQSTGLQRVGHDFTFFLSFMHKRSQSLCHGPQAPRWSNPVTPLTHYLACSLCSGCSSHPSPPAILPTCQVCFYLRAFASATPFAWRNAHGYLHGLFLLCSNAILSKRHPDQLVEWGLVISDLTTLQHTRHNSHSTDGST